MDKSYSVSIIILIILLAPIIFQLYQVANATTMNMSNDFRNVGIQTLNITGALNITDGQQQRDQLQPVLNSILPIVGTIAGTILGTFTTYFYQKKTEEKKTILEDVRKREYASVILQISTKELNSYKVILAKIRLNGRNGRPISGSFAEGEYFIQKDTKLDEIRTDIKKTTNLYSKLPLETRTSIFLSYLNSIDSAYEHYTNFKMEDKYNYKGVYSNDEITVTINKIDVALQDIEELSKMLKKK